MDKRKQKLIEELKSERLRFAENGHDTTEHDIVIQYLLLGKTSCNPDKWGLLDGCFRMTANVLRLCDGRHRNNLIINRRLSGGYCKNAVSRWPSS